MRRLFEGRDPQLVLFDLDGTLVDSVPDLAQAVDRMLAALGRPQAGVDRVRNWVGNGAAVLVQRALTGALETGNGRPPASDEVFDKAYGLFLEFYAEATADQSRLYPGVRECLDGLAARGIVLGVATNKPMRFTTPMLEGFGLSHHFSVVLGGDSLPTRKPDPAMLLSAIEQCGASPCTTLMVGDSSNDVKAARAAGCPVAAVPYGYNHGVAIEDSCPDLLVQRLDQLL
ncbi:phosphoglycolate phosphatase 1 [Marinobacterium nitratireducens]|uniref:Phosphoglycolate phosphatase n=1 Tax=Marinobacterium nitratireducens TaxID=518897 RepID=A0A917ZLE1_9GAMM|nr:phosphoglycolate phosphatase [Marinobacterium nitratireducens]GGO86371.1 phosphoglycolate phosphatase 1 [Marinobacterium nitratireducens]